MHLYFQLHYVNIPFLISEIKANSCWVLGKITRKHAVILNSELSTFQLVRWISRSTHHSALPWHMSVCRLYLTIYSMILTHRQSVRQHKAHSVNQCSGNTLHTSYSVAHRSKTVSDTAVLCVADMLLLISHTEKRTAIKSMNTWYLILLLEILHNTLSVISQSKVSVIFLCLYHFKGTHTCSQYFPLMFIWI